MTNSPPTVLPPGSQPPTSKRKAVRGWVRHPLLLALFLLVNFMTLALSSWGAGGVPFRAVAAVVVLSYTFTAHHRIFMRVVVRHRLILYLLAGFALLGTMVSLANYTEPSIIIRQVMEIHAQATLNLLVAAVLVELCGPVPVLWTFAIPVTLSVLFALAQAVNSDAAWALRETLGAMQHEVVEKYSYLGRRERPMGLSYSPITLATQLCLLFAGYGILREQRRRLSRRRGAIDPMLIWATLAFVSVCLLSGNRSPILGILLFVLIYLARQKRAKFWFLLVPVGLLLVGLLGPILLDSLQESGSRVASVDDKSAMGRVTLYYYGFLLFIGNPIGYGLDFDPTRHWQDYWGQISSLPNAGTVQNFPLHNYVLNMLNFYGVGLFLLTPFLYMLYREYRWAVIYFVPYIMHVMFHNSGPFWSDPLVWIILAIAAGVMREMRDVRALAASSQPGHVPAAAVPSPSDQQGRTVD